MKSIVSIYVTACVFITALFLLTNTAGVYAADDDGDGKVTVTAPKLKSVTNQKDHVLVKWSDGTKNADGIQIECSEDKTFASVVQTVTVVDPAAKSSRIEGLKDKTLYYVRIRSFRQSKDDYVYSKWTGSKEVDYGNVINEVMITNKPQKMIVGGSERLKVRITPEGLTGQEITWKSSDPKVISVDKSGRIKAVHGGNARVTVSCSGKKASCKISVNIKGIITIIDDDGRKEFMKKLLPIIKEKKVSIATAVVPECAENKTDRFMSWNEIKKCKKDGAEVLCHTLKHRKPVVTNKMKSVQLRDEYEEASRILKKQGYDGDILVYCYSTGKIKKAQKCAAQVYKCAIDCSGFSINTPESDMYFLRRYKLEPYLADDPGEIKGWIDNTKKNGGWMIWSIHCETPRVNDKALKNLRNIIDYARKQGVEIVTAKTGYKRLSGN